MQENTSYRIRTNVGNTNENVVNVKLDQHYDMLEILSLRIDQENVYKTYESDYGVIVGRVIANGGFGVPNAKVSVFIESDWSDDMAMRIAYPYNSPNSRNADGIRYNLLTDFLDKACYQNVGTFPNKRLVLDNDDVIDVFDKYYRYTTVTNSAGDYMIFGVPTGNQRLHVDVDLSDIGMLSQRPRDMIYKGYNINQFESPNKFKQDTNLNSLAQILTQDIGVYVYPYWGDTSEETDNIAVTRADIQLDYKFEPTCVFIGSIITDTGSNAIGKNCTSTEGIGKMSELIAGEGSIEMIRKTYDGKVEEFQVKGNRVIDGDGVWCYQIPMNLDYIMTDEFGNIVPSDNPEIGIPTRTRVRFRISIDEAPSDNTARKRCRYLVPNNPRLDEARFPQFTKTKEPDYEFGSRTREESYKDLLWNKVYTVKNYIPRLQKNRRITDRRHTGIKLINHHEGNNPMPYNNVDIKLGFTYRMLCVIFKIFINLVQFLNQILTALSLAFCAIYHALMWIAGLFKFPVKFLGWPFRKLASLFEMLIIPCVGISSEMCGNNTTHNNTFFPGCGNFMFSGKGVKHLGDCIRNKTTKSLVKKENKKIKDGQMDESERTTPILGGTEELYNCVETALAEDNDTISLNFQNDWVNGTLYAPMWFRKITNKRKYFFGLIRRRAKDQWCEGEKSYTRKILRKFNPCSPKRNGVEKEYTNFADEKVTPRYMKYSDDKRYSDSCRNKCHEATKSINLDKGLIVKRETMLGQDVYYYKPVEYSVAPKVTEEKSEYGVPESATQTDRGSVKILFATDIVLLGSLNDCDIHGVPQLFKSLENTTFNLPPNLLFADNEVQVTMKRKNGNGGDDDDPDAVNIEYEVTEVSSSEMTGMDWGNFNTDICGKWNDSQDSGLFYSIGCSTIKMKPKSCINMSRICEFGVSLDESKSILTSSDVKSENSPIDDALYESLTPDGFISKDELYNDDERSMFATLNANDLETERNQENGLMEYVFKRIVVENFDKSLNEYMKERQRKCDKPQKYNYLLEEFSRGYYDFRMGRKPYFYDSEYRFPRYENSFYFYFGLTPGKTAIDKFNSQFTSNCLNSGENVNPINIDYVANSWCSEIEGNGDGYVAFDLTSVDLPCDIIIQSSTGIIHDPIEIENNEYEKFYISLNKIDIPELNEYVWLNLGTYLPNGTYEIVITDNGGEIITTTLTIEPPHIKSYIIGTDFYEPDNVLMGRLKTRQNIMNNKECLPEAESLTVNSTRLIGGTIAVSMPYDEKTGEPYDVFTITITCENVGYNVKITYDNGHITPLTVDGFLRSNGDVFIFGVPKGGETYTVEIRQLCKINNVLNESDNVYRQDVLIRELAPYKLYINGTVDYDVIKHWDCGFNVVSADNDERKGNFQKGGCVCENWWHMSDPANYLWCNYLPYQNIDKQICANIDIYQTIIENYEDFDTDVLNAYYENLRNGIQNRKHFMYAEIEQKDDSAYACGDSFVEIDIDETILNIKKECCDLFKKPLPEATWNGYVVDYANFIIPEDGQGKDILVNSIKNGTSVSDAIARYEFTLWAMDNKDYMPSIEDNYSAEIASKENFEIPPYIDLLFVNLDIIELLNEVYTLKNDFINNTKSAFQLTCSETPNNIFYTVDTRDFPITYHSIYTPEEFNDDTGFNTLTDYNECEAFYTKEEEGVDNITIPTITHRESKNFGNTNNDDQLPTNLCFATDNNGNKKRKFCNFVAVINGRGRTIPNDAVYDKNGDDRCGIGVDYTEKVITRNYFGYHIIDKIFENRFMMWSYFDRIPYYKPKSNDGCLDNNKSGVSICMNGIFASKIFNGNATEYKRVYVRENYQPLPETITKQRYETDEAIQPYYEKHYWLSGNHCVIITVSEYDDLPSEPDSDGADAKNDYEEMYVLVYQPQMSISEKEYNNLPDSDKGKYVLSYETIFEEQRFSPYTLNIYTGRTGGESDADVEDRMPTIRYVVGEKTTGQQSAVGRSFENYRVTKKSEADNLTLWELGYHQQYIGVNNRSIEMVLSDENNCSMSEQLDGRMRIVLSEDSVNFCSLNNKNHRDNSKFNVTLENANGDNVTYFVFNAKVGDDTGDGMPYPLNDAKDYDDCPDRMLCRKSKFDMKWDSNTDEKVEVFSQNKPKNLFSYYTEPSYKGKTARLGAATTRKELKSKMIDPNSNKEIDTEGFGNTGVFKMERHDKPYFVVAITDNNCRAISPVYDFSYVCAKLIFGVVYSKQETVDENGYVNGYENIESPKVTFDVANAIIKDRSANCNGSPSTVNDENCVKEDEVLYYFYYYPYKISFECKLDDENTVSGSYTHLPYRTDPNGYTLFSMDHSAFESLKTIYKRSNQKVGKNIRNNTVIMATDYTGLKHNVDWYGCQKSQTAGRYGCGYPYEVKEWVVVTWVTNCGKWKRTDGCDKYIDLYDEDNPCDPETNAYYGESASFSRTFVLNEGVTYDVFGAGDLEYGDAEFLGWATSYDATTPDPGMSAADGHKFVSLNSSSESDAKRLSVIYYAIWKGAGVKVMWFDCFDQQIGKTEEVRPGTVISSEEMASKRPPTMDSTVFRKWVPKVGTIVDGEVDMDTLRDPTDDEVKEVDGNYVIYGGGGECAIVDQNEAIVFVSDCMRDNGPFNITIVNYRDWYTEESLCIALQPQYPIKAIFCAQVTREQGGVSEEIMITKNVSLPSARAGSSISSVTITLSDLGGVFHSLTLQLIALFNQPGYSRFIMTPNPSCNDAQGHEYNMMQSACGVFDSDPDSIYCESYDCERNYTLYLPGDIDCSTTITAIWIDEFEGQTYEYWRRSYCKGEVITYGGSTPNRNDVSIYGQSATGGYTFNGWDRNDKYAGDEDITFVAQFTRERLSYRFIVNGRQVGLGHVATYGDSLDASDFPSSSDIQSHLREGDEYTGLWEKTTDDVTDAPETLDINSTGFSTVIIKNTTFTAILSDSTQTPSTHTVRFFVKNTQVGDSITITDGETVGDSVPDYDTVRSKLSQHETFNGFWKVRGTSNEYSSEYISNTLQVTSDIDFDAVYATEIPQITVNFDWNYSNYNITEDVDGGTLSQNPSSQIVSYGDTLSNIANVPSEVLGYVFAGWNIGGRTYRSDELDNSPAIETEETDITIYGVWNNFTYTVRWMKCDGETLFREDLQVPYNFKYGTHSGFTIPTAQDVEIQYCTFDEWDNSIYSPIRANVEFDPTCNCMTKYAIPYYIHNNTSRAINTIGVKVEVNYPGGTVVCGTNMGGGAITAGGYHYGSDFYADTFPSNWRYINYDSCDMYLDQVGHIVIDNWNVSHSYKTDSTGTYKLYTEYAYWSPDSGHQNPENAFHIYIDEVEEPTPPPVQTYSVTFKVSGDGVNANIGQPHTGLTGETDVETLGIPTEDEILLATQNPTAYVFNGWDRDPHTTVSSSTVFIAQVSKKTYSVLFAWNDPNNSTVARSGIKHGEYINSEDIPSASDAPSYPNHTFSEWLPDPLSTPITSNGIRFDGQWESVEMHTVYFHVYDEDEETRIYNFNTLSVAHGAELTKSDFPSDSDVLVAAGNAYEFDGLWKQGRNTLDFSSPIVINRDIHFDAWVYGKSFIVTFMHNNGTGDKTESRGIPYGGSVQMPAAPVYSGHVFNGWLYNGGTYQPGSTYQNVISDMTFTAQWGSSQATVKFYGENGVLLSTETVNYGETVTPPSVTVSDSSALRFKDAWIRRGDNAEISVSDFQSLQITQNMEFDAKIVALHKVRFFTADEDRVGNTRTVEHNGHVTTPDASAVNEVVSPTGKTFMGTWRMNGPYVVDDSQCPIMTKAQIDALDITEETNFYARLSCAVTFDFGSVSSQPDEVYNVEKRTTLSDNGIQVPQPTAVSGYSFNGWDGNTSDRIMDNITFTAQWVEETQPVVSYTVTWKLKYEGVNGSFSEKTYGTTTVYSDNNIITQQMIPSNSDLRNATNESAAYSNSAAQWDVNPLNYSVNESITFTATLDRNTYAVKFVLCDDTEVPYSQGNVRHGATVNSSYAPNAGTSDCTFNGWIPSLSTQITSATTFTADCDCQEPYHVIFYDNNVVAGTIDVMPGNTIGQSGTIPTATGANFSGWAYFVNDVRKGTKTNSEVSSMVVTSDCIFRAVYQRNYTITYRIQNELENTTDPRCYPQKLSLSFGYIFNGYSNTTQEFEITAPSRNSYIDGQFTISNFDSVAVNEMKGYNPETLFDDAGDGWYYIDSSVKNYTYYKIERIGSYSGETYNPDDAENNVIMLIRLLDQRSVSIT